MVAESLSPAPSGERADGRDGGASRPRAVLLLTARWARDGGVGAHVQCSAALLAEAGVHVTVLVGRVQSSERIEGVVVHESRPLFDRSASVEVRLGEALSDSYELVHIHQVDDPVLVDALQVRAPVVVSAHGYPACTSGVYYFRPGHECTRGHGPGCVPNLLGRGCAHMRNPSRLPSFYGLATRGLETLRRADLAVSYSSSVDRHLAANGISQRTIVPYFPTMRAAESSSAPARNHVVFAGRVAHAKGVHVLIRAAREVDAEFTVCGDGPQLEAMRRLARRYAVHERVHFTGWLGPDDLSRQLAGASVLAVPSIWPEPFGIVGIEAFAAGRPAVASATGGIGDWLQDGVSGLLVKPGDARALGGALAQLLADPGRQHEMGAAGREHMLASYSPERHLSVLLSAYARAREAFARRSP